MSTPSLSPSLPRSRPANIEELIATRESAIRAWASIAIPRELPRIGTVPNGDKDWLRTYGIEDAEWGTSIRPQIKGGTRPGILKERIWIIGILATSNYHGELAMTKFKNRLIALTSNRILKQLNQETDDWAASVFPDLTPEEKYKLHATKQDVRRALASLEDEGRALRTLKDGTLLRDLPTDRKKGLQQGDILLFFMFRPFKAEPNTVVSHCLPKFAPPSPKPGAVVSKCLPMFAPSSPFLNLSQTLDFSVAQSLKLLGSNLDPKQVGGNDYLKRELNAAVEDYRKRVSVVLESVQKRFSVATESAHIEINSVINSLKGTVAAASSEIHSDSGESSSSFAEPTTTTASTTESNSEPERMPDAKFSDELTRIFIHAGKDNPTRKQTRETRDTLIDHPQAPAQFLRTVQSRIEKLKHPGVLPDVVAGFNDRWPGLLEIIEANAPRPGEDPAGREAGLLRQFASAPKGTQASYREVFPDINFEQQPEKAMAAGAEEKLSPFKRAEKEANRGKK